MKFSKKVLKNGLRVVTIPMKDNPTVTVLVLVEAGSKYETKRVNGISHFLEHMCSRKCEIPFTLFVSYLLPASTKTKTVTVGLSFIGIVTTRSPFFKTFFENFI